MHTKAFVFSLILLMQVCGPLLAQTSAAVTPAPPGLLQELKDRAWKVSETAKYVGATALGFFSAYYEDHIQPVTDGYAKWASDVKTSTQNKIQTIIDNYMPFIAK